MKEKTGEVFSIAKDNAPVRGCTVSREVSGGTNPATYYSLAENTDISAEIHPYHKLILVSEGKLSVYGHGEGRREAGAGEGILTPAGVPVGVRAQKDTVYTEIQVRKEDYMNEAVQAGEVFKLADLVPYQEGKIVNMDLVHSDGMKFVVMAFDKGTGLSEHAAPGEALIFALDGEGVIGYEGKEHVIRAGENFHFAKGGLHFVKATERFKMALFLTLE
ncbi:cupin domain-containing protein [Chordicoccus furentiruminis]|uniref:cupin domain-containing protein n=1 Tax=Chordicoccus furentiruminis TaxID=2709410 RepID=UPI0023A8426F|nr:cupin domain-containing protein [Chordicoccus furentiruminis]